MRYCPLFAVLLALTFAAAPIDAAESATPIDGRRPPNVLVILADDLGYGDLSSYGGTDVRTPNIDALMSAGMRFDNFYANCSVCSPTRAALLTGRYPDLVGVPGVIRTTPENNWGNLTDGAVLLPQVLRAAGYDSGVVGKWHLGLGSPDEPLDRGFDTFRGFLGDMMDDYHTHLRHGHNYMRDGRQAIEPKGHATDLFTAWAVEHIRARSRENRPFFLYLAYNAPHTPIQPPDAWVERVKKRQKNITDKRASLVALIEHMDAGVGQVIAAVRESGAAGNTLVIFTSDNGGDGGAGGTSGPLRGFKQDMYEGGIRAPFAAVWPGRIKAGSRSDRVALTMDLLPTIADAAGAAVRHTVDGRSFLPTLLGEAQAEAPRTLVWMRREGGPRYQGMCVYAVRQGPWKLVYNSPFAPLELYNLAEDPGETRDLMQRKPLARVVPELTAALRRHQQRAGRVVWQ